MSRPDSLSALPTVLPAADPARAATPFHDSKEAYAIPHAALARLPSLHHEAGRDLQLWRFLASSPPFCMALMLEGAVALAAGSGALDADFLWAAAILIGIAAVTGNHIRGFARSPRLIALTHTARELRLLLLYLGISWGLGAFLILPQTPGMAGVFAAIPSLIAALILQDEKGAIAFGAPVTLLTAGAVLGLHGSWALHVWAAAAILVSGIGIAGLSMLHCAILRRRLRDIN